MHVALLAEGVDRNIMIITPQALRGIVALLAEGVDRNRAVRGDTKGGQMSPSSRRAWIEITSARRSWQRWGVALLAEGVDRNGS